MSAKCLLILSVEMIIIFDGFADLQHSKEITFYLVKCALNHLNIRMEPCGRWLIVLFMVVSFVIGCVSYFFQNVFFSIIVFGLVIMDF